jgi:hypothetical protein
MDYPISIGHNFTITQLIAVAVVLGVLFLVGLGTFIQHRRQPNSALRDRFVSDHDRVFLGFGSAHLLGGNLINRVSPGQAFKIRELSASEREWVVTEWQAIQSNFAEHPRTALIEADDLMNALLVTRGYYRPSFAQHEAAVSVDGQHVLENYRAAHSIAVRFGPSEPTTAELGTAMIKYRETFDFLLHTPTRPKREPLHESRLEAEGSQTRARAM